MKIHFVNAYRIRQYIDPDFNVMHCNRGDSLSFDSKWYIPQGEMWCDIQFQDEADVLFRIETSTAQSREEAKQQHVQQGPIPEYKHIRTKQDGVEIILVDGSIVRAYIDPWFVMGGHGYVYDYIPEHEIWIDKNIIADDIPLITLHEITERNLMKHEHKPYETAHEYAVAVEREARRRAGGLYPGDDEYPYETVSQFIQTIYVTRTK